MVAVQKAAEAVSTPNPTVMVPLAEIVQSSAAEGRLAVNARTLPTPVTEGVSADETLARDIHAHGQMSPIYLAPLKHPVGTARYFVLAGNRRFLAMRDGIRAFLERDHAEKLHAAEERARSEGKTLDREKLPKLDLSVVPTHIEAKIVGVGDDEVSVAAVNLRENYHREDLHWTDRAKRLTELAKLSALSIRKIADVTGIHRSTVERDIKAADSLIPEIWDAARNPVTGLGAGQCYEWARLSAEEQAAAFAAWQTGTKPARKGKADGDGDGDGGGKVTRPSREKIDAAIADIEAGGYDSRGEDWIEGALAGLMWAAGRVEAFEEPDEAPEASKAPRGAKKAPAKKGSPKGRGKKG